MPCAAFRTFSSLAAALLLGCPTPPDPQPRPVDPLDPGPEDPVLCHLDSGSPSFRVWPSGGEADAPRNLRIWLHLHPDTWGRLELVHSDWSDVPGLIHGYGIQLDQFGSYSHLYELIPTEEPAPYQADDNPVAFLPGTELALRTSDAILARYRIGPDADDAPPAAPAAKAIETWHPVGCRASIVRFQISHEPDTLVFAFLDQGPPESHPDGRWTSWDPTKPIGVTDGTELVLRDIDVPLLGRIATFQFRAVDRAGNWSPPALLRVRVAGTDGDRQAADYPLELRIQGPNRGAHSGFHLPIDTVDGTGTLVADTVSARVTAGTCSVAMVTLGGGAREAVVSGGPGRCSLAFDATSRGRSAHADLSVDLLPAVPLVLQAAPVPCPDGSPYYTWVVGGTRVCRAVDALDTLVFTRPDGSQRRVRGTGITMLDPEHLLACHRICQDPECAELPDEGCDALDAAGQSVATLAVSPFDFPRATELSSGGGFTVPNRGFAPDTPLPRTLQGKPYSSFGLTVATWDGGALAARRVESPLQGFGYFNHFWQGPWAVAIPYFNITGGDAVVVRDILDGSTVATIPLPPGFDDLALNAQVVDPYLRVADRLYLGPSQLLPQRLPLPDLDLTGANGCLMAARRGFSVPYELWWLDVCADPVRAAVVVMTDPYDKVWPDRDGLWARSDNGRWDHFQVMP